MPVSGTSTFEDIAVTSTAVVAAKAVKLKKKKTASAAAAAGNADDIALEQAIAHAAADKAALSEARLDKIEMLLAEVTHRCGEQRCEEERGSRKAVDLLNDGIQRCAEEHTKLLDDFTHRWAEKVIALNESVEVLKFRVGDAEGECFDLKTRLDEIEKPFSS